MASFVPAGYYTLEERVVQRLSLSCRQGTAEDRRLSWPGVQQVGNVLKVASWAGYA